MGKGTDKLYITHSEWSGSDAHGASTGARSKRPAANFARLPFDCCALSLKPFEIPVCTIDGNVYDLGNIIPYIRAHGTDPVTGKKLASGDLIKLNFHKNADGDYFDPVTFKVFTEHTPLVAIKTSGNVFSRESVDRLNVKAAHWRDLVTDEPFERSDLITLQDPHNVENKDLSQFHHLRNNLRAADTSGSSSLRDINIGAVGGGASKLIKSLVTSKESESATKTNASTSKTTTGVAQTTKPIHTSASATSQPHNLSHASAGRAAASFTSTSLTPQTKTERELVDEEEWMFQQIQEGVGFSGNAAKTAGKAYVRMVTNLGNLNLELYCDRAPKTCFNFIMLARDNKYNNCIFHRSIPGFMIQGGDPTGTGRGGESYWGAPFRDEHSLPRAHKHEARGVLSMANSGPNTNSSQFFMTFRATPHLNGKHTVFGHLVGGEEVLAAMEKVPIKPSTDRPTRPIKIIDMQIFKDPFEDYKKRLERKLAREQELVEGKGKKDQLKEERDKDKLTWFGTTLGEEEDAGKKGIDLGVGKYLAGAAGVGSGAKRKGQGGAGEEVEQEIGLAPDKPSKKARKAGEFGNFEGW